MNAYLSQVTHGDATVVTAGSEKLVLLGLCDSDPRNPLGVISSMTLEVERLLNSYSLIAGHNLYVLN